MTEFLKSLVGPGLIAAFVAFALTTRDERRRTYRDYLTKFFENTSEDIRQAVIEGASYFTASKASTAREHEIQVLLYESAVRSSLAAIRNICSEGDQPYLVRLREAELAFIDALTGGSFGAQPFAPAPPQARAVVGRGTILRSELQALRKYQLETERNRVSLWNPTILLIGMSLIAAFAYGVGLYTGAFPTASSAVNPQGAIKPAN